MHPGNVFSRVDDAVARAYADGKLRMSVLADAAFNRVNTKTNTPAFCEIKLVEGAGATLHVLLKGGGSDNASRVVMLTPGAGLGGVRDVVLECVREKAANACPPLLVGVGIGATFDKGGGTGEARALASRGFPRRKRGSRRPGSGAARRRERAGHRARRTRRNAHRARRSRRNRPMPHRGVTVAVNMGCCAMRSTSIDLLEKNPS